MKVEPRYDEFGVPLTQSGVAEHIWALYVTDFKRFKDEVNDHFSKGYKGWTVVTADYANRIIWIRDDRPKR